MNKVLKAIGVFCFLLLFCGGVHAREFHFEDNLEVIRIEGIKGEVNELLSLIPAYERYAKKTNKEQFAGEMKRAIILRGIALTEKLIQRADLIANDSKNSHEYKAIHETLTGLSRLQNGISNLNIPFIVVEGAPDTVTEKNSRPGTFDSNAEKMNFADYKQLGMSRGARIRSKLWRMKRSSIQSVTHFGEAYSAFMIATGLLTFVHLSINYEENPVALNQYLHHATDPLGAVSFGAFMAANGFVVRQLHMIQSGIIPRSFIPYIGMAAGLVASSLFYELASDPTLHTCIRSKFENDAACDQAYDTWVVSNKILQYSPAIVSLSTSVALSGALTAGAARGIQKASAAGAFNGFKGITLGPKLEVVKKFGESIVKSRYVLSVGSFFVFLAFDRVLGPKIFKGFQSFQLNQFDLKAWMDKKWFHRDYWRKNDQSPVFYIEDVFDVEATNLPTADNYLNDLMISWRSNDWQPPEDLSLPNCFAQGLFDVSGGQISIEENDDTFTVNLPFEGKQKKPESMRRCEVLSQPERLVERYGEVQEKWRQFLLTDFYSGLYNWVDWSSKFSMDYYLSYELYNYIMQMKLEHSRGGEKPDLSKEALLQKMVSFAPPPQELQQDPRYTETLTAKLDSLVHQMACGTTPLTKGETAQSGESLPFQAASVALNTSGYGAFRTPWGSAASFNPPAVVRWKEKSPCQIRRDYSPLQVNQLQVDGLNRADEASREAFYANGLFDDTFNTAWQDENGNDYENLIELVFDNADPEVWKTERSRQSRFSQWWVDQVKEPTEKVWAYYEERYHKLFQEKMVPVLVHQGVNNQPYESSGVLQSFETEFEAYRRPAQELLAELASDHPGASVIEDMHEYLRTAQESFSLPVNGLKEMQETFPKGFMKKVEPSEENLVQFSNFMEQFADPTGFELPTDQEIWLSFLGTSQEEFDALSDEDQTLLIKEKIPQASIDRFVLLSAFYRRIETLRVERYSYVSYAKSLSFEGLENYKKVNSENGNTGNNPFLQKH